eukprot:m.141868 g.141868  ORF g.141868 m.141868 type:complete len:532 (+) comp14864_c0_seq1:68-1663(+)
MSIVDVESRLVNLRQDLTSNFNLETDSHFVWLSELITELQNEKASKSATEETQDNKGAALGRGLPQTPSRNKRAPRKRKATAPPKSKKNDDLEDSDETPNKSFKKENGVAKKKKLEAEKERLETERIIAEKKRLQDLQIEKKREAERIQAEKKAEAERLKNERLEIERQEAERLEAEKKRQEQLVKQKKLEAERKREEEKAQVEARRLESEKLKAEKAKHGKKESSNTTAGRISKKTSEKPSVSKLREVFSQPSKTPSSSSSSSSSTTTATTTTSTALATSTSSTGSKYGIHASSTKYGLKASHRKGMQASKDKHNEETKGLKEHSSLSKPLGSHRERGPLPKPRVPVSSATMKQKDKLLNEKRQAAAEMKRKREELLEKQKKLEAEQAERQRLMEEQKQILRDKLALQKALLKKEEMKENRGGDSRPKKSPKTSSPQELQSYDISDLHSDAPTDDEDEPSKPVPKWAQGGALRTALYSQIILYGKDGSDIFSPVPAPDMGAIFSRKNNVRARTSSARWSPSPNGTLNKRA